MAKKAKELAEQLKIKRYSEILRKKVTKDG